MRKNLSPKNINFQTKLNYIPYRELLNHENYKSAHQTHRSNVSFNPFLTKNNNVTQNVYAVQARQDKEHMEEQDIEQNQANQKSQQDQNLFQSRLEQQEPPKILQNTVVLQVQEESKIQHSVSQTTTYQYEENKIIDNSEDIQNREPEPLTIKETETPFEVNQQNVQNVEVSQIPEPAYLNNETEQILKRLEEECQNQLFKQNNQEQQVQIIKQEIQIGDKKQDSKKSMLSSQSKSENPEKRDKQKQIMRGLKAKPFQNPFAFKKPEQKFLKKVKSSENPFTNTKTQKKLIQSQKESKNPFIKSNKIKGTKLGQIKSEQKFFLQKCESQYASFQNSRSQSQANLQAQPQKSVSKNKVITSMKSSKTKTPDSNKNSKLLMRFKKVGTN